MKRTPAQRKALAVEFYKNGFTYTEIARETRYKVATVDKIIKTAANGEVTTQRESVARLEQGLSNFVQYGSAQSWYTPINQYQDPVMRAFGRVKLPQLIKQVLASITVDDLLKTEDPYEALALAIGYPKRDTSARLAQLYFNSFTRKPPQNITVAGLMDYLRKGIVSDLIEQLKVPIHVDKEGLEAALKKLTPKQEDVIRRRFFQGETLSSIGKSYSRSVENIRQAEGKALRLLRYPSIFPGIRYATPQRLLEHARNLEETVAMQDLQIAQRDLIISEYKSRFGPLQADSQPTILREELDLREKLGRTIEGIDMSVRSYNCLKNVNVKNIRALVQKTENDLLRTKNFGRKSLNEIIGILAEMGLHLGMELPEHLLKEN